MEPKDIHERFLEANANPEFISGQFEEAVRDLLRAVAAVSDTYGAIDRAERSMSLVMSLIPKCKEPLSWHLIFHATVDALRQEREADELDRAIYDAAKAGMGFIAEATSTGGARNARIAKRERTFLDEVERIHRLQEERSQGRRRGR